MLFVTSAMRAPMNIGDQTMTNMSANASKQVKHTKITTSKISYSDHQNFDNRMLKTNFMDSSDVPYTIKMNNNDASQSIPAPVIQNKFEVSLTDGRQRMPSNYDSLLNGNTISKNSDLKNVNT